MPARTISHIVYWQLPDNLYNDIKPNLAKNQFANVLLLLLLLDFLAFVVLTVIFFLHFWRYCGERRRLVLSSTANTLEVKFHSDESYTDKGFRAVYTAFDPVNRT